MFSHRTESCGLLERVTEKANKEETSRLKDACTQAGPQGGYRVTKQRYQEHVAFFIINNAYQQRKNTKQYKEKYFFRVKFSRLLNASTDILMI